MKIRTAEEIIRDGRDIKHGMSKEDYLSTRWVELEDLIDFIKDEDWYHKVGKAKIWEASNDVVVDLVAEKIEEELKKLKDGPN
jgi:ribosome-associated protein YbcJ (S4-like RNA binding protein)